MIRHRSERPITAVATIAAVFQFGTHHHDGPRHSGTYHLATLHDGPHHVGTRHVDGELAAAYSVEDAGWLQVRSHEGPG